MLYFGTQFGFSQFLCFGNITGRHWLAIVIVILLGGVLSFSPVSLLLFRFITELNAIVYRVELERGSVRATLTEA